MRNLIALMACRLRNLQYDMSERQKVRLKLDMLMQQRRPRSDLVFWWNRFHGAEQANDPSSARAATRRSAWLGHMVILSRCLNVSCSTTVATQNLYCDGQMRLATTRTHVAILAEQDANETQDEGNCDKWPILQCNRQNESGCANHEENLCDLDSR